MDAQGLSLNAAIHGQAIMLNCEVESSSQLMFNAGISFAFPDMPTPNMSPIVTTAFLCVRHKRQTMQSHLNSL